MLSGLKLCVSPAGGEGEAGGLPLFPEVSKEIPQELYCRRYAPLWHLTMSRPLTYAQYKTATDTSGAPNPQPPTPKPPTPNPQCSRVRLAAAAAICCSKLQRGAGQGCDGVVDVAAWVWGFWFWVLSCWFWGFRNFCFGFLVH